MHSLWQFIQRGWFRLVAFAGLIGTADVLLDVWGFANDLISNLQNAGLDLWSAGLRFSALVLFPAFAVVTLITIVYAICEVLKRYLIVWDAMQRNDRWALRRLKSYDPEIRQCTHLLEDAFGILTLETFTDHPAIHIRLQLLAARLNRIGISVAPSDTWNPRAWQRNLEMLIQCADYNDIVAARRLFKQSQREES